MRLASWLQYFVESVALTMIAIAERLYSLSLKKSAHANRVWGLSDSRVNRD